MWVYIPGLVVVAIAIFVLDRLIPFGGPIDRGFADFKRFLQDMDDLIGW